MTSSSCGSRRSTSFSGRPGSASASGATPLTRTSPGWRGLPPSTSGRTPMGWCASGFPWAGWKSATWSRWARFRESERDAAAPSGKEKVAGRHAVGARAVRHEEEGGALAGDVFQGHDLDVELPPGEIQLLGVFREKDAELAAQLLGIVVEKRVAEIVQLAEHGGEFLPGRPRYGEHGGQDRDGVRRVMGLGVDEYLRPLQGAELGAPEGLLEQIQAVGALEADDEQGRALRVEVAEPAEGGLVDVGRQQRRDRRGSGCRSGRLASGGRRAGGRFPRANRGLG